MKSNSDRGPLVLWRYLKSREHIYLFAMAIGACQAAYPVFSRSVKISGRDMVSMSILGAVAAAALIIVSMFVAPGRRFRNGMIYFAAVALGATAAKIYALSAYLRR